MEEKEKHESVRRNRENRQSIQGEGKVGMNGKGPEGQRVKNG